RRAVSPGCASAGIGEGGRMQIIVAGRNIEISEALRARVTEKVGRLAHHFEQVHKAQVVLRVEPHPGRNQIVEVTVWADGVVLRGEEARADMYASIDHVVDKLDKQDNKVLDRGANGRRTTSGRTQHKG